MPSTKRTKTKYPGVFFTIGTAVGTGKPEKVYYIRYRKDGKQIEEKAGRQFQDDMSPAKASEVRVQRIRGKEPTNEEFREVKKAEKEAEEGRWTISRLWEAYEANNPGLKGLVTDNNRFENHIKPVFGDKEPVEIAPLDVDRLRLRLLKIKSPGTVKNVLELLRRIINYGEKKKLCVGPGFTIQLPDVNNQRTEDLSPDQLAKLLETINKSPNIQAANMMRLALFTGMRRGELFKLKWEDVDFERAFITLKDPKGGPDQKIPLNDGARAVLESHPREKSPLVFPGRGGQQRTDVKRAVNKIRDDAGLPEKFRALHGIRHVFASMLASSGEVDMYTLQKLLTHKSPQMTMRYAHLRDETLKRASGVADEIIGKAVNGKDGNEMKATVIPIERHT